MRVIFGPKNDTTGGANQLAKVNTALTMALDKKPSPANPVSFHKTFISTYIFFKIL